MKALSFSQPWLWAIFDPAANKEIENRHWPIPVDMIGVPIAAHAAKSFDDEGLHFMWEREIPTSTSEYVKSAIIGTFVVDRVVTSPKTLTENQRRWYMGNQDGVDLDGRTVYGHVLGERKLLPRPIPWDGALGLWPVPPLIEHEIQRQLAGDAAGRTPPYLVPLAAALAAAGVTTTQEWVAAHPGEHLYFEFDGIPSCAACGKVKPREGGKKPPKPCRGIVSIEIRGGA